MNSTPFLPLLALCTVMVVTEPLPGYATDRTTGESILRNMRHQADVPLPRSLNTPVSPEQDSVPRSGDLNPMVFSGQLFFSYGNAAGGEDLDQFAIKRGYITFRRAIHDRFMIRFTQDISIDEEGDGAGDIELRLKYAYVGMAMDDRLIFSTPNLQIGVVNRPWIDFEQDVNDFRAQREMFLDENAILSSADYGITFTSGLGPELQGGSVQGMRTPLSRYGSMAIGVYNGGGYSALEVNQNKLIEGRLTLRPLPELLPRVQMSGFGAKGKGNVQSAPEFSLLGTALSYESPFSRLFLQAFQSKGDGTGLRLDPDTGEPNRLEGWSVFTELRPLASAGIPVSLVFRADRLVHADLQRILREQVLGGIGYVFGNRSKIFLDLIRVEEGAKRETGLEWVIEVRF